jgi:RHS repeat-associated protein
VVAITNGEGENVDLTYNGVSLVASLTQPTGATLAFPLYGQHGHWLEMDGAGSDKRSFDTTGNPKVESAKGRRGGVLNQQFDPNRAVAMVNVAASDATGVTATGAIAIERRSDGQPVAVRRPYGGDHEFDYDALGRLAQVRERVDGGWQATLFERDLAGNTTARSRPNGMREEWEYDGYGRTVRYRALRNGTLEGEATYLYQGGQLVSMVDSIRGAGEQYGYDEAGRLLHTTYRYGEVRSLEYDLRSRVTAESYAVPGQLLFDIGFEHDLANRLVRTLDRRTQQILVERVIDAGRVRETRYGNGLVRSYAYDGADLILAAETRNASGQLVESTLIERSGETNPVRLQVRSATTTPLASTEEEYWLDAGEALSDPGKRVFGYRAGPGAPRSYAYDELSNQISAPGGASYSYNTEHNRLLAAGSLAYGYDEAGFATSRGGVSITWTAAGRLASYGSASANWDLSGRLVELAFDGVTRRFDLFGGRLESDASVGAIGPLDLGDVSLEPLSGERTYRHLDFRGNVSFVSNGAGEITNHHRYGPYGVEHSYGTGRNTNTFVGKPEAGPFMLLGARIYEPATGRFLTPDPLFTPTNQYTYTSGNPVFFADVGGLFEVTIGKVAAIIGFGAVIAGGVAALPVSATIVLFVTVQGPVTLQMAATAFSLSAGIVAAGLKVAAEFGLDVGVEASGSASGTGGGGGGGGSGGGSGAQIKQLTFQVGDVVMVQFGPAAPASCSPTTLGSVPGDGRGFMVLLVVTLVLGVGSMWRRSRSVASIGRGGIG